MFVNIVLLLCLLGLPSSGNGPKKFYVSGKWPNKFRSGRFGQLVPKISSNCHFKMTGQLRVVTKTDGPFQNSYSFRFHSRKTQEVLPTLSPIALSSSKKVIQRLSHCLKQVRIQIAIVIHAETYQPKQPVQCVFERK